jgi:hypothetical protein
LWKTGRRCPPRRSSLQLVADADHDLTDATTNAEAAAERCGDIIGNEPRRLAVNVDDIEDRGVLPAALRTGLAGVDNFTAEA